jgi:hypothetical protein
VFLGLIVEYTILLWLKRKDLSKTDITLTIIAGIAISLGVGGEYLFGSKASDAAMRLEDLSEQRVANLNKEAGDARKEAATAMQRASRVDERSAQLGIELEQEKQKTARSQKEAADAQLAVKSYIDLVAKSANPRFTNFDPKRFVGILAGKLKGSVDTIWYEPDDMEAYEFASVVHEALGAGGARWDVGELKPLPREWNLSKIINESTRSDLEELRIEASDTGSAVGSNMILLGDPTDKDTALRALTDAIDFGTGGWNISGVRGHLTRPMSSLPVGHFIIVVGHHRINVPLWIPTWQHSAK